MKNRWAVLVVGACLAVSSRGRADDMVTRTQGIGSRGRVVSMNSQEVVVEKAGRTPTRIPANEIRWIAYEGEPKSLKPARAALLSGRYKDTLEDLAKIALKATSRKEIRQDVSFYTAFCRIRLALEGS